MNRIAVYSECTIKHKFKVIFFIYTTLIWFANTYLQIWFEFHHIQEIKSFKINIYRITLYFHVNTFIDFYIYPLWCDNFEVNKMQSACASCWIFAEWKKDRTPTLAASASICVCVCVYANVWMCLVGKKYKIFSH